jgi:hypothetical protein
MTKRFILRGGKVWSGHIGMCDQPLEFVQVILCPQGRARLTSPKGFIVKLDRKAVECIQVKEFIAVRSDKSSPRAENTCDVAMNVIPTLLGDMW